MASVMNKQKQRNKELSIGQIAERTGINITAIRFYEEEDLLKPLRNAGGQRRFDRSDIRRLSFIKITQQLGFSLAEVKSALASLPHNRTPTRSDWQKLSSQFAKEIEGRIAGLTQLRDKLDGCIGCGCLSMKKCGLYNPQDSAAQFGAGPRFLMGDSASDLET